MGNKTTTSGLNLYRRFLETNWLIVQIGWRSAVSLSWWWRFYYLPKKRMITEKAPSSRGLASGSDCSLCHTFSTISINSSFTSILAGGTSPTEKFLQSPRPQSGLTDLRRADVAAPRKVKRRVSVSKKKLFPSPAPPIHSYFHPAITAQAEWAHILPKSCMCTEMLISNQTLWITSLMNFLCFLCFLVLLTRHCRGDSSPGSNSATILFTKIAVTVPRVQFNYKRGRLFQAWHFKSEACHHSWSSCVWERARGLTPDSVYNREGTWCRDPVQLKKIN